MGKPIPGILGGDAPQSASDGFDKCGLGPRLGAAQGGFELAPHLFDGIELRRVGWQEEGHRLRRDINETAGSLL